MKYIAHKNINNSVTDLNEINKKASPMCIYNILFDRNIFKSVSCYLAAH